jgi:hypothetical protein
MRRWFTALVLLGTAGTGVAAVAPAASAASPTCLVVDTTSNQSYTSLQAAVTAAAAGDTLFVKGACTGTTAIGKNLTISGHSSSGTKAATLNGGGQGGSVLTIDTGVSVTLNTLVITNGFPAGGIINAGGTVTLNGSTVSNNITFAPPGGGGILNAGGTVTLNGSTVTENTANLIGGVGGGGITNSQFGTVTMSGGSTVTENTAIGGPGVGGILNFCGSTLVGAVAGVNVYNNNPGDILNVPC